jgi:hypothetical protein
MSKNSKKDEKTEDSKIPDFDEGKQCPVCIEVYSWSGAHKRVVCPYCNYAACRSCVETTLTNPDARKDPECFACHKMWTREFIHDTFTKTFQFGELKRHREQVLFDRERSLLPATQTILEKLDAKIKQEKALAEEEYKLRMEARQIKERLRNIRYERAALNRSDGSEINMDTVEHKTFVRPCPAAGCRGYLSTRWKCPLCETWVCKDCHVIKKDENDDQHRCKEDDLKSAQLIMNETKPCPKCGTRIFKNGGCPQMWCTNCHTGFSWSTGRIEKGPVHNPHYFEWLAKNGNREEKDDHLPNRGVCGEINIHKIEKNGGQLCGHINWYHFVRFVHEVEDNLARYPTDNTNTYLSLRLSFLRGNIDEDQFKRSLQMKEKKFNKLREEREIFQTFSSVAREELIRISGDKVKSQEISDTYDRLLNLGTYVNNHLIKLSYQYNNVFKAIGTELGNYHGKEQLNWFWSDTNKLQGKKKKKDQTDPDENGEDEEEYSNKISRKKKSKSKSDTEDEL